MDPSKTREEGAAAEKLSDNGDFDRLAYSDKRRYRAIKSLLENMPVSFDDKLATVKTAHHVDKAVFQIAFRNLMGNPKY